MSSEEKQRRELYKRKRNKWIAIQSVIIGAVLLLVSIFVLSYKHYNQDYLINYNEYGKLDYKVYIHKDEFYYESDYLPSGQSYIAEVIDYLNLNFKYEIDFEEDVDVTYSYKIESYLEIVNGANGGSKLLTHSINDQPIIASEENVKISGNMLLIDKTVDVDYEYYDDYAQRYLKTYKPTNAICTLVVKFSLNDCVNCNQFKNKTNNTDTISFRIPLATNTVKAETIGLSEANGSNTIICTNEQGKVLFKSLIYTFSTLVVVLCIGLVIYIYLTRNTDINYSIKVNKIVNSYKSFIQKTISEFDTSGYQILEFATIRELLEIRDTLQKPILMHENEDKTCAKFMILADDNMLYMYEIKVEDYDKIYNEK